MVFMLWRVIAFGFVTFAWFAMVAIGGEVVSHRLESERLAGNFMGARSSNLVTEVYLPNGYHETDDRFPVLYWFGGWGLGSTNPMGGIAASSIDAAIESGKVPPTIIVSMPVDAPTFDHSLYLSSDVFGDWEGFATSEVIPFIDANYRTIATPESRGIAGFSAGGFTALMLPLLQPNTWGAIGAIDPSSWTIAAAVRDAESWPEMEVLKPAEIRRAFARMPYELDGFRGSGPMQTDSQWYGQVAARLSPNPESPVYASFPIDRNGEWVPEVREAWRQFDLADPAIASQHTGILHEMAAIHIVIPEAETRSVALWNHELVATLQQVGVNAAATNWPGDHGADLNGRFIAMLEDVIVALVADDIADINRNGVVESNDLQSLIQNIELNESHARFDVNADENVDLLDAEWLARRIGPPNFERLTVGQTYSQNFDSLGQTTETKTTLPAAWTVSDHLGFPIRDVTNLNFPADESDTLGIDQPFALNAGNSDDRSLAVYKSPNGRQSAIQLLAETTDSNANALRLGFTIEAWERIRNTEDRLEAGAAAFNVVVDIATNNESLDPVDFVRGGDFQELLSLPTITTEAILVDSSVTLDGNAEAYRTDFENTLLPANIPANSRLRFRWITADDHEASEGWVFGIDDIEISLLFLGDFDGTGELDLVDLEPLIAAIQEGSSDERWDVNRDQAVDVNDLYFWIVDLKATSIGDADLDGAFESGDFIDVFQSAKYETGDAAGWHEGDWNADGVFDSSDLIVAFQGDGYEDVGPIPEFPVPEPPIRLMSFLAVTMFFRISRLRIWNSMKQSSR